MKFSTKYAIVAACLISVVFAGYSSQTPSKPPKKTHRDAEGNMRITEEYKQWQASQKRPSDPVMSNAMVPFVSSMRAQEALNSESTSMGFEPVPYTPVMEEAIDAFVNDDEMAGRINLTPKTWSTSLDDLFEMLNVPVGLLSKLFALSEFDELEFLIDDSGSMTLETDGGLPSRWIEAKERVKDMMRVLAYVPTPPIRVCCLNRCVGFKAKHENVSPQAFLADVMTKIDTMFLQTPSMGTPYFLRARESLSHPGNIVRYWFSDGVPTDDGRSRRDITNAIKDLVVHRQNPDMNPITFMSVSPNDEDVEWMKEVDEFAPFTAEMDDYNSEYVEVVKDQGPAFPYSKGFWILCGLVGALNPTDLDAADESVPFTSHTFLNMLGVSEQSLYQQYWNEFIKNKPAQLYKLYRDESKLTNVALVAFNFDWTPYANMFASERQPSAKLDIVKQYKDMLKRAEHQDKQRVKVQRNPLYRRDYVRYYESTFANAGQYKSDSYGQAASSSQYGSNPYGQGSSTSQYGANSYGQGAQSSQYGANLYGQGAPSSQYGQVLGQGYQASAPPYNPNMAQQQRPSGRGWVDSIFGRR